jgi:hypothetical protein
LKTNKSRHRDCSQNSQNGDYDHQFNKCETLRLHVYPRYEQAAIELRRPRVKTLVPFHDHALGFPSSNHQAEAENSTTSQDHAPYPSTAR